MLKNTLADDGLKLKEELGGYHAEGVLQVNGLRLRVRRVRRAEMPSALRRS